MKYENVTSNRFKRDLKRCQKRGLNMRLVMMPCNYWLAQVHFQTSIVHIN